MFALLTPSEEAELHARTALEEDVERVVSWFAETAARRDAFGGVMIDHAAGGKLVVLATSEAAGLEESWRDIIAQRDRLEIRTVSLSLSKLESIQLSLREAILAEDPIMDGWVETALDTARNAVVVAFEGDVLGGRAAPLGFFDRFGLTGLVVVEADPSIATVDLESDPNAPPVYGGHSWKIASHSGAYCSLGFNVGRSGFSDEWMVTAGHCIDQIAQGANMYHASRLIGTRGMWAYQGAQDFGLIKLSSTSTAGPHLWYLDHSTGYHTRRGVVGSNTSYAVGNIRCFTGWRSNWTECGAITVTSADTKYCTSGCPAMFDLAKYDVSPLVGDSGGPVFRFFENYAYAAGIQSGSNSTGTRGYFAKWSNLPASWDIVLKTYTPPTCNPCPI